MATAIEPLQLNGSHGEGGGALLRTVLAMSVLTGRPVIVGSVRGGLRNRGLASEDMMFLDALSSTCDADVVGALGDDEVEFYPRRSVRPLRYSFSADAYGSGTVSACVIAQALLPVLARAGGISTLDLRGSTHGPNTLAFDAIEVATLESHRLQGLFATACLKRAAFFPSVEGHVEIEVEPSVLEPLLWTTRGPLDACGANVTVTGSEKELGGRAADALNDLFQGRGLRPEISISQHREASLEIQVTCWARFENGMGSGTAVGRSRSGVGQVATQAFEDLMRWYVTDATVDPFLADQLLLPACLAEGRTEFSTPKVTRRLTTMAWAVRQFMPIRVTVHGTEGGSGRVTIER
ncbi:MAG: RNA 3'-terminal phosphate cyclase [Fimbriimonadaceae bacterium]